MQVIEREAAMGFPMSKPRDFAPDGVSGVCLPCCGGLRTRELCCCLCYRVIRELPWSVRAFGITVPRAKRGKKEVLCPEGQRGLSSC